MEISLTTVIKSDMISVPIPSGTTATKFPFPDQPQLRGVHLRSLFMPFVTYDIQGNATLNQGSDLLLCYLVLYFDGKENIQQIPLAELIGDTHNVNPYNINGYLGFGDQVIIWPKSYILAARPLVPGSNYVFTFSVNYSLQKN